MEYLMSYGWAILIIAVVLGVLFQLGVFSGSALTPKVPPGACTVERLLRQVSLEGQCTGQLPQSTVQFSGITPSIYQSSGFSWMNSASQPLAISIWVEPTTASNMIVVEEFGSSTPHSFSPTGWADTWIEVDGTSAYVRVYNLGCIYAGSLPTNTWSNIVLTYNGVVASGYVDGVLGSASGSFTRQVPGGSTYMIYELSAAGPATSCFSDSASTYNGLLANYQIYNATLSASEVKALYLEGIGGAPVKVQNIAWWLPLNGDMNDYSGNNDNGAFYGNPTFTQNWQTGYTPP